MHYDAFTDIEFNHNKSINCQAYSVALYQALKSRGGLIEDFTDSKIPLKERQANFLAIINDFDEYKGIGKAESVNNSQGNLI